MNKSIEITGTVETVLERQEFSSGFAKRVLVINTGGEYPQMIPVEFTKAKTDLLDGLREGQEVTAHCNIRGNEYQGKYYTGFQGWKLDKGETQAAPEPADDSDHIPF
jgi:single-strand DNA-binding protein